MNLQDPISSIMSTDLKTLQTDEKLQAAKDIFDSNNLHHIPVLKNEKLVGMMSKVDYYYFLKHYDPDHRERYLNDVRLKNYKIDEVMSKRVVTIESKEPIRKALEIFSENLFHALPVEDNGKLVGMITTHDIIYRLLHPKMQITN